MRRWRRPRGWSKGRLEMRTLRCVVAAPDGLVWEGEASSIVVPAADGELGILPRHAPMVVKLGCGELRIAQALAALPSGETKLRYFVEGGFVQVGEGGVRVLASSIEPVGALSKAKVREEIRELAAKRPPIDAPPEEVEKYDAALDVLRRRLRLAPN